MRSSAVRREPEDEEDVATEAAAEVADPEDESALCVFPRSGVYPALIGSAASKCLVPEGGAWREARASHSAAGVPFRSRDVHRLEQEGQPPLFPLLFFPPSHPAAIV